jgi:subtilisin family serine protease
LKQLIRAMHASRSLGLSLLVGALSGSEGARISRRAASIKSSHKLVAGVPVLNYDMAYGGKASLSDLGQAAGMEEKWIVVVAPGTTDAEIMGLCGLSRNGCMKVGHPSSGGVPFLEIRGTEEDLETVLAGSYGVAHFVEPDLEMHAIPDMQVDAQTMPWGLERVGCATRAGDGAGVHVYVADTGIRHTHNDYGGRAIPTIDMTSDAVEECNGALDCAKDGQGHGSHCAGTVAGTTYGVAPMATLHSAKVLSDTGSGSFSWSYLALDWIATKGERPAVVSMSLGGSGTLGAMKTAVDATVAAGVTVVVAGGNSNADACGFSPAFVPSAITVGSTTSMDARSSFSNYGSCTDMWAPGSSILSCGIDSDTSTSTLSGTSMACPHVSGGAAIILGGNAGASPAQVLSDLLSAAEPNAISGLMAGDTNKLLWVSSNPAPAPPPVPPPPPYECPYSFCGTLCWYDGCALCDVCK